MKPDYKNWVPRGLLFLLGGMAIVCLAVCTVFGMAGASRSAFSSGRLFCCLSS